MTIEEAIKTAIEYEIRIRDIYLEAAAAAASVLIAISLISLVIFEKYFKGKNYF